MPPSPRTFALLSEDEGLRVSVAAMLARGRPDAELVSLPASRGWIDLRSRPVALVFVDADTVTPLGSALAAGLLAQTAPLIALWARPDRLSEIPEACRRNDALRCWRKRTGPAAPGLAGAEGKSLLDEIADLLAPRTA